MSFVGPASTPAPGRALTPMPKSSADDPDAGLRPLDHYKYRLPHYRYLLRQRILPLIRWETPHLAYIQSHARSPLLDSYFAFSANLGTHTFFMIMLPILFWFGYTSLGRSFVHVLAAGVFFSGFAKDFFCLPRPLSPPLHRITMSGSAALEYGFPSTHSTNAVSVALYGLLTLRETPDVDPTLRMGLTIGACVYAITIVVGRIYCGMHGFLDVIVGSWLGATLAIIEWYFKRQIDAFIYSGSLVAPAVIICTLILLVRIHPEPADQCPCFDDGVAFAGVVIGVDVGHWHYAQSPYSWNHPISATVPFDFEAIGLPRTVLRVLLGIFVIFAWREIMKPFLHTWLPPLYRFMEEVGWNLPRKHFINASEYKSVPSHLPDDTLFPITQLPTLLRNVRRVRSDSVGPQSAADAYETLAFREKTWRETSDDRVLRDTGAAIEKDNEKDNEKGMVNGAGEGEAAGELAANRQNETEKQEREIFSSIERPRVRYDVEVVTKLIVYAGIAWWAVEGTPLLFEWFGLGVGVGSGAGAGAGAGGLVSVPVLR